MKKNISIAGIVTLGVYPSFLVLLFITKLFSNTSFSFFGFGLDLEVLESSAEIGLFVKPYFFLSFVLVFVVCLGVTTVIDIIKTKERVIK